MKHSVEFFQHIAPVPKPGPFYLIHTALFHPVAFWFAWIAIRRYRAVQSLWELSHLVREVRQHGPRHIVEIGTHLGGTLYCWSRMVPKAAKIVSIDLPADPGDPRTMDSALQKVIPGAMQKNCGLIRADSHHPATLEKVRETLGYAPVDFLFIDGDHSYEGVKMDFEMYGGLVRSGGVIAFHDILPNPDVPDYGVAKFWLEMKSIHETRELVDPQPAVRGGMGIGLITVL